MSKKILIPVLIAVIVLCVGGGLFYWKQRTDMKQTQTQQKETTFYAKELGRNVTYDGKNYYDSESGEYFWFNPKSTPGQWQYWYEPVSGNYGDYGWMEYGDDNTWYIEVQNGDWQKVPDQYQDSVNQMWHFSNAEDKDAVTSVK